MAEIGQLTSTLIARAVTTKAGLAWGVLALALAAAAALWLWPFTVDDALISIRYARHLALGFGYRFNVGGPHTDGVTPLPWPFVLWLLAHAEPLVVLARAKALGLAAWLVTACTLGTVIGRCDGPRLAKVAALVGLGVCVPLAVHAVSGMETAIATSLATTAALLHQRPRLAAVFAGLAASFRPEMLPWALVLATAFHPSLSGRAVALLLASFPFVACAVARLVAFGSPAPLSLVAKPSDLAHGFAYAGAAALASVGPLMAFAPVAAARERGPGRAIALAGGVHLLAVAVAGGDWMPFARLVVPIVPSLLYASVLFWPCSRRWAAWGRAVVAIGLGLRVLVLAGPAARNVGPDREGLARRVGPLLVGRQRVAAVDIGWVSAATEADIIDLAGVTDPDVAALGGGHTSKRIDASFLLAERPDAFVLYAEASDLALDRWADAFFPRVVEARLARSPLVEAHFAAVAFVPLGATGTGYYVLFPGGDSLF